MTPGQLQPGSEFAGFRVQRRLGVGGMSEVYLVLGRGHDRLEALKILDRDASRSPRLRTKFRTEATVAELLVHPNIVSVHEHGEFEGQLWMSMHYVDGYSAARLVARGQIALDVSRVARIVAEVAKGLDYAHSNGVLHRDVKPSNILISTERVDGYEQVLLSDWGIARLVDDSTPLVVGGTVLASIHYAAPELLRGGVLSAQTDVYALGGDAGRIADRANAVPVGHAARDHRRTSVGRTACGDEASAITAAGSRRGGRTRVGQGPGGSIPDLRGACRCRGCCCFCRSAGAAGATLTVHPLAMAQVFLTP